MQSLYLVDEHRREEAVEDRIRLVFFVKGDEPRKYPRHFLCDEAIADRRVVTVDGVAERDGPIERLIGRNPEKDELQEELASNDTPENRTNVALERNTVLSGKGLRLLGG